MWCISASQHPRHPRISTSPLVVAWPCPHLPSRWPAGGLLLRRRRLRPPASWLHAPPPSRTGADRARRSPFTAPATDRARRTGAAGPMTPPPGGPGTRRRCRLCGLWWCSSSEIWRDAAKSDTYVAKSVSTVVESSFSAIAKPEKMKVSSPWQRRDDCTRTSLASKQDLARSDLLRHNIQISVGCITIADYS